MCGHGVEPLQVGSSGWCGAVRGATMKSWAVAGSPGLPWGSTLPWLYTLVWGNQNYWALSNSKNNWLGHLMNLQKESGMVLPKESWEWEGCAFKIRSASLGNNNSQHSSNSHLIHELLTQLILTKTPWGWHDYCAHFSDEKQKHKKHKSYLLKIT